MSDQLAVLKLVASRLDAAGIAYMVTGSIAAGHYGQPRMTRDIDIVAQLVPPHAERLPSALGPEFLCDADLTRAAILAGRSFSVIHLAALEKVDLFVRADTDYELEKFDRRQKLTIDGQAIWMISPEDLILSKLVWMKAAPSDLQVRDVRSILAFQALDWAYLDRWAVKLTVARRLGELRS